jgi:hypothetical protein
MSEGSIEEGLIFIKKPCSLTFKEKKEEWRFLAECHSTYTGDNQLRRVALDDVPL